MVYPCPGCNSLHLFESDAAYCAANHVPPLGARVIAALIIAGFNFALFLALLGDVGGGPRGYV
jgi:hypothetical protein